MYQEQRKFTPPRVQRLPILILTHANYVDHIYVRNLTRRVYVNNIRCKGSNRKRKEKTMIESKLKELSNFLRSCPKHSWFFGETTVSPDIQEGSRAIRSLREISLQRLCSYIETSILHYPDFEEVFHILDSLPTLNCLTDLWSRLDNKTHSFVLLWLSQGTTLCKNPDFILERSVSYNAYDQGNLIQTIQLLNNFDFKGYNLRLTFTYKLPGLERLTQLRNLRELTLHLADRIEVESLLRGWHSYLKLYPQSWKQLAYLEIPMLLDPRLLYDTLLLIPSLRRIKVGIRQEHINDVPVLRNILSPLEITKDFHPSSQLEGENTTIVNVSFRKRAYAEGHSELNLSRAHLYLVNSTSLETLRRSKQRARRAEGHQDGPTQKLPKYKRFGLLGNTFNKPKRKE